MMSRILASELVAHVGERVTLRGWLNNVRALGKICFLILRDRSGLSQIIVEDRELIKVISSLQPGSILTVRGMVQGISKGELLAEIVSPEIDVEVPIHEVPPLEYYKPEIPCDLEYILDHRPIALRNRQLQAVFKVQAELTHAFRLFMHDSVQATEYFAPNIIGASSEGGAEFFNVDYFGHTATLAQSSQLYKQIMVGVNERVFALMPFFRAENSNTPRHLTEGKQFEFEMGFFDHWHDVLDVQENCIKFIVKWLRERCAKEISILGGCLVEAPEEVSFPRVTFEEAQEIYFKRTGIDDRAEPDLSPGAERELCAYAKETFGTDLIFVIDWKTSKRPFYAFPKEENPELSNTFDLLCAGTEITSGGQRRHTHASMLEGLLAKGMNPSSFEDYLSIFKCGMPPHGGFGMGLERLTMTLLHLKNIREASLFPSDPKRIAGNRIKAKIFYGGENIRNEIFRLLKDHNMDYRYLKHDVTPTSADSARVRETTLEEGVKAIIVRGKTSKKNYQLNIPAHLKLDMKLVGAVVGEKCEFEDPETIRERFGLFIGGIPPFGQLLNIEIVCDPKILESQVSAFNCGLVTESIVMKSADLIALIAPKLAPITAS